MIYFFFFFNDTATTEIYTLSLHDALPIYPAAARERRNEVIQNLDVLVRLEPVDDVLTEEGGIRHGAVGDRKSTRLNSSHSQISYAVFCLKKKKKKTRSFDQSETCHQCRDT